MGREGSKQLGYPSYIQVSMPSCLKRYAYDGMELITNAARNARASGMIGPMSVCDFRPQARMATSNQEPTERLPCDTADRADRSGLLEVLPGTN